MKYGESTFDVLYLIFAIVSGCVILAKAMNRTEKHMGLSALVLGCGDAFHLVPRVLNYFVDADFTASLGIGKLVTSVTMTVFYVLLYYVWLGYYYETEHNETTAAVWILAALRIVLCALPQNGWLQNSSDMTWGIIRNVPFVALGAVICVLYFRKRTERARFKPVWILHSHVVPVLYPGRGRRRRGSDPRNADAAQNRMLHPFGTDVPALDAEGRKNVGKITLLFLHSFCALVSFRAYFHKKGKPHKRLFLFTDSIFLRDFPGVNKCGFAAV